MALCRFEVPSNEEQCGVAEKGVHLALGRRITCCPQPVNDGCFSPLFASKITELWEEYDAFLDVIPIPHAICVQQLKDELRQDHLLELRYTLNSQESHVLLVCAWSETPGEISFSIRNPNDSAMIAIPASCLPHIDQLGDWNYTWVIKKKGRAPSTGGIAPCA
jgi:hypothetical protein